MVLEKDFEDILCKYPELIESDLRFIGRQITLYGRRIDILFEDKFSRKLIIELKAGAIKDEHIGQILSYEGMLLTADDPTIRVMLIGSRVPPNIQRSLDHHGIAWREITNTRLKEYIIEKNDTSFISLFEDERAAVLSKTIKRDDKLLYNTTFCSPLTGKLPAEELVERIKSSDIYKSFNEIMPQKIQNEESARQILIGNTGRLNHNHLKEIFKLVDKPYPCLGKDGKKVTGPWFGMLLRSNTGDILKEDLTKINKWFEILFNKNFTDEMKIKALLTEPYKINRINVGFITLMLYILDKHNHLIWFEIQHEGLCIANPDLKKYTGNNNQYSTFNNGAKIFAKEYGFEHTELDWVFSTGLPMASTSLKIS